MYDGYFSRDPRGWRIMCARAKHKRPSHANGGNRLCRQVDEWAGDTARAPRNCDLSLARPPLAVYLSGGGGWARVES